ncbi:MAG TPA: cell wall-binding repeat-containing protein [Nocardioidaceae bacterium]|nr:cell wall-binding repeat-containing protein [Nocardioidaceae bacterium]
MRRIPRASRRLWAAFFTLPLLAFLVPQAAFAQGGQNVGITQGWYSPAGLAAGDKGETLDLFYSAPYFCDTAVPSGADSGCEAGAKYRHLPPGATTSHPVFIPVPLGGVKASVLQCPKAGHCIDHPGTVDLSRIAGGLPGSPDPGTVTNEPLGPHDHIVLDRNGNRPGWWSVVMIGVTKQSSWDAIDGSQGNIAVVRQLQADPDSGVMPDVATNMFVHFQTLPGLAATRLAGADRFQTAIAISQDEFPSDGSASAVVLARSDVYPDALTGAPLAAAKNGPLLLTRSDSLQPATKAEIGRVLGTKSDPVYLVGGPGALSPSIESALADAGYTHVQRLGGKNRYQTAVRVAGQLGDPGTVFLATGLNFPDALTAGPAVIEDQGAILLTKDGSLPDATSGYLESQDPKTVYAVGGPACRADTSAECVSGKNRYATSANVADRFFPDAAVIGAATGQKFPDALTGGPDMALHDGPMMLVRSDGDLPPAISHQLAAYQSGQPMVYLFGGPSAIPAQVVREIALAADGN